MEQIDHLSLLPARFPRLFQTDFVAHGTIPAGWVDIVNRLMEKLDLALDDDDTANFQLRQVKQKLGSLRFYWALHGATITVVDFLGTGQRNAVQPEISNHRQEQEKRAGQ